MNIEARLLPASLNGINYRKSRGGRKPDVIVLHVMEGTQVGTDQWFRNPQSGVSAHYGVSKTGTIWQWVLDTDTAFHAGTVVSPVAAIVLERAGQNPNSYSLGIEHEGHGSAATPAQLKASVELAQFLARKHNIPVNRRHFLLHNEIRSTKSCPGALLNMTYYMASVGAAVPVPGARVWSDYFNDWLLVTRYVSDSEWYFIPVGKLHTVGGIRASAPYSKMPRAPLP